jgi:hypothetical protein
MVCIGRWTREPGKEGREKREERREEQRGERRAKRKEEIEEKEKKRDTREHMCLLGIQHSYEGVHPNEEMKRYRDVPNALLEEIV